MLEYWATGRLTRDPEPFKTSGQASPLKQSQDDQPTLGVGRSIADTHSRPSPRDGCDSRSATPGRPTMGSRPATSPLSAFEKKEETGDGRSTALPYVDYQGQVWLQYAVPEESSVPRGTVAILALTTALTTEHCSHVGPH